MGNLKYKLTEKVEFIEPRPEKDALGDRDKGGRP